MSKILAERDGGLLRLVLNRPDAGNALDIPMARQLMEAAIAADTDPSVRCVLLTGRGRFFCVGGDIAGFVEAGTRIEGYLKEITAYLHAAVIRLSRMEKPLLVAVNGPAAGGGMGLALLGDIVIAAKPSHFTPAYSAIGLTPDCGLSWNLPRLVGLRRAQELLIGNRRVDAEEAVSIGLISRAVEADRFDTAIQEQANRLAQGATAALGGVRALLMSSHASPLEAQLDLEARTIAHLAATPSGQDGIRAFLEKRK